MKKYLSVIRGCTLFRGIAEHKLDGALTSLCYRIKTFKKNEVIREAEEEVREIGIVLDGSVFTTKFDINGNRFILAEIPKGGTFGEALAITSEDNSPISIVSAGAVVMLLSVERLKQMLTGSAVFSAECDRVITHNLVRLLAEKNLLLQIKNDILSQKSIRGKLLLYFQYESAAAKSKSFKISFSREELADFLSLNPSALSRELGKMRDEGILRFQRNRFTLTD